MAAQAIQAERATSPGYTEYPRRHLFTLDEYERMIEAGIFAPESRLELIRGEILEMTPIGFPHEMCVAQFTMLLSNLVGKNALVWPQNNSIRLVGSSRPQPDLAVLKWRTDYSTEKPPSGEDVILVIEVADTSLANDRRVKGVLYAEAGIPVYWIVNLPKSIIEVYTEPGEAGYKQVRKARRGESLSLPEPLGGEVKVSEVLPEI